MFSAPSLNEQQRSLYEDEGYLVLEGVFGSHEVDELRKEADRVLEIVLGSSILGGRRNPRLDIRILNAHRLVIRKVQPINDLSARFAKLSSDPRILGPMGELMGDYPVLMEEKLNYKQRIDLPDVDLGFLNREDRGDGSEGEFLVHHDWGYYRHNHYPPETMSSALALDDCAGKGPLRVVPGSHREEVPLRRPGSGSGVVDGRWVPSRPLLPVELTAGSLVLFHSKLVHDSEPNKTDEPRRLMIYSHYPASHDGGDPDRRNRPTRLAAVPLEEAYLKSARQEGRGMLLP